MKIYKTKAKKLPGTRYADAYKKAFNHYNQIKRKTKRRPYVRSAYFNKDKVFLELFWRHYHQKNWHDRARRVPYFPCAIELIRHSRFAPTSKENPNDSSKILHRFAGITPDKEVFYVQIKVEKRTGKKWLMSVFPEQN